MAVALCGSCAKSSSRNVASDLLKNKNLTQESVLEALDKIALTDPDSEDNKREEVVPIISAINEPKLLFNLTLKLLERSKNIPGDGKCIICHRYDVASYLAMDRLADLRSDEATKYLVRLIEVKAVDGDAKRTESLLYNIVRAGKPALPYLKELKDDYLAQEAIKCIENNAPCY
jgi:hypothetical protein